MTTETPTSSTDMSTKTKTTLIVSAIIFLISLLAIVKYQYNLLQSQNDTLTEMKELKDNWVRSQTQVVTKKELEALAKSLNIEQINKDLNSLGAKIDGIAIIVSSSSGYHGTDLGSTNVIPRTDPPATTVVTTVPCPNGGTVECPKADPFGFMNAEQKLSILEPFPDGAKIPFGETGFKAWQKAPWSLDVYKRNYNVQSVIGEDDSGKKYVYNKMTIDVGGKTYAMKITSSKFVEELPQSRFRFSPRIHLGVSGGAIVNPKPSAEFTPTVEVALFSYGRTSLSPDWTFLSVGVGFETQATKPALAISPVNYNIGHHLPLVSNLHIGPIVAVDTLGSFSVLAGVRVGL